MTRLCTASCLAVAVLLLLAPVYCAQPVDDEMVALDDANRQAILTLDTAPMPTTLHYDRVRLESFFKDMTSMLGIEVEFQPEPHRGIVLEYLDYESVELREILLDIAMREKLAFFAKISDSGKKTLVLRVLERD